MRVLYCKISTRQVDESYKNAVFGMPAILFNKPKKCLFSKVIGLFPFQRLHVQEGSRVQRDVPDGKFHLEHALKRHS